MQIVNLRNANDIHEIVRCLDNEECKDAGIYINEAELRYYRNSPWIEAFILIEKNEVAGFASINLSEKAWGRGTWMEFYIMPSYRHKMCGYKFYKAILTAFAGCHRICSHVRVSNKPMYELLVKLGWKTECVIRRYDRDSKSYYQLSYNRGAKE